MAWHFARYTERRRRRRRGGASAADVRERRPHPARGASRVQYPSSRPAAAPCSTSGAPPRRAADFLRARHLLPDTSSSGRAALASVPATRSSSRKRLRSVRTPSVNALYAVAARTTRSGFLAVRASSRSPEPAAAPPRGQQRRSWRSSTPLLLAHQGQRHDGRPPFRGASGAAGSRSSCSARRLPPPVPPSSVERSTVAGRRRRPDRRCSRTAAGVGRPRPLDGAGRARHCRNGRHDHLRLDVRRQASRNPERRGRPLRRGPLREHPLAERRRDPPGPPHSTRARTLLAAARQAVLVLAGHPNARRGPGVPLPRQQEDSGLVNRAVELTTGYSPPGAAPKAQGRVVPLVRGGPGHRRRARHAPGRSGLSRERCACRRKDGTSFLLQEDVTPLQEGSEWGTRFVSTARDITRQNEAEERLSHPSTRFDPLTGDRRTASTSRSCSRPSSASGPLARASSRSW